MEIWLKDFLWVFKVQNCVLYLYLKKIKIKKNILSIVKVWSYFKYTKKRCLKEMRLANKTLKSNFIRYIIF